MHEPKPYNPLDKNNLGMSVASNLLKQPLAALPPDESFDGAGIYAIYYMGDHPCYRSMAGHNQRFETKIPIYVGKAIPDGARKGGFGLGLSANKALAKRLREHAKSIEASTNLELSHFRCRHLVVDDIWIPLGEAMLIEQFQPVWNTLLDGFGNHDPGKGRYNQSKSAWDVLHPGRPWADKCQPNPKSSSDIEQGVIQYFSDFDFKSLRP